MSHSPTLYQLIVYVPEKDAQKVRDAMSAAGAGRIGAYDSCSFSVKGVGRFRPLGGSHPAIGSADTLTEVAEERIEVLIPADVDLQDVLRAIKKVHPYEEPAIHVLPMVDYKDVLKVKMETTENPQH